MIRRWLSSLLGNKNAQPCRPIRRSRLSVEVLEGRELLSATVPGFSLTNGNLYNTNLSQTTPIDTGVKSFAVANGKVYDLHADSTLESLNNDGTGKVNLDSNVVSFAVDGAGSVVDLSQGRLGRFSTGSPSRQEFITGSTAYRCGDIYSSFLVDGAGFVLALGTDGYLSRFAPGSADGGWIDSGVKTYTLDGAGSVFSLGTSGLLAHFAPGSSSRVYVTTGSTAYRCGDTYSSFLVDGAGFVLALGTDGYLSRFAPGSADGGWIDSGVKTYTLDGAGSVFSLGTSGLLAHFAPGSSSRVYVTTGSAAYRYSGTFTTFRVDGAAFVTALGTDGYLSRFASGSDKGGWIASNTESFAIDGPGRLIDLENDGRLWRRNMADNGWDMISSGVGQTEVDGFGRVVDRLSDGRLERRNAADNGWDIISSGVGQTEVDGFGRVVDRLDDGRLERRNAADNGWDIISSGVGQTEVDGFGRVVDRLDDGRLERRNAADNGWDIISSGVAQTEVDGFGRVVDRLDDGRLERRNAADNGWDIISSGVAQTEVDGFGRVVDRLDDGRLERRNAADNGWDIISSGVAQTEVDGFGRVVDRLDDGRLERRNAADNGWDIISSGVAQTEVDGFGRVVDRLDDGRLERRNAADGWDIIGSGVTQMDVASDSGVIALGSDQVLRRLPAGGTWYVLANGVHNGMYAHDATNGAVALIQNFKRIWLSPAAYAYIGSPVYTDVSDAAFNAIPAGPNYAIPDGAILHDHTTVAIDIMVNGQRCWLSGPAYAYLGSPHYVDISDTAFKSIPAGPNYAVPNGTYFIDSSNGEVDILKNGQRCWISPAVYRFLGHPHCVSISHGDFTSMPSGPTYIPNGVYAHDVSNGAVGLIKNGKRDWLSPAAYAYLGYPAYTDVSHAAYNAVPVGPDFVVPNGTFFIDMNPKTPGAPYFYYPGWGTVDIIENGRACWVSPAVYKFLGNQHSIQLSHADFIAMPTGPTYLPNGVFARDAKTHVMALVQNDKLTIMSELAYESLWKPDYTDITHSAFRAMPNGPDYVIPNGTYLIDSKTGEVDIVENGQRCWVSLAANAFLGNPAHPPISDAAFISMPKGEDYYPHGMITSMDMSASKSMIAGDTIQVTLTAVQDHFGKPCTGSVFLFANGANVGTVHVANGSGTIPFSTAQVGILTLTAKAGSATDPSASNSRDVNVGMGVATKLTISVSGPTTVTANTPIHWTINAWNQNGVPYNGPVTFNINVDNLGAVPIHYTTIHGSVDSYYTPGNPEQVTLSATAGSYSSSPLSITVVPAHPSGWFVSYSGYYYYGYNESASVLVNVSIPFPYAVDAGNVQMAITDSSIYKQTTLLDQFKSNYGLGVFGTLTIAVSYYDGNGNLAAYKNFQDSQ